MGEIAQLAQLVQLVQELVKVTAYIFAGTVIIVIFAFLHSRFVSRIIKEGEKETMKKGT